MPRAGPRGRSRGSMTSPHEHDFGEGLVADHGPRPGPHRDSACWLGECASQARDGGVHVSSPFLVVSPLLVAHACQLGLKLQWVLLWDGRSVCKLGKKACSAQPRRTTGFPGPRSTWFEHWRFSVPCHYRRSRQAFVEMMTYSRARGPGAPACVRTCTIPEPSERRAWRGQHATAPRSIAPPRPTCRAGCRTLRSRTRRGSAGRFSVSSSMGIDIEAASDDHVAQPGP